MKKDKHLHIRASKQELDTLKSLAYDTRYNQSRTNWLAVQFAREHLYEFLSYVKLATKK